MLIVLHFQVQRNRMQCIVTLLCRGAKANCADQEGITPLHMAAGLCSATLVQVVKDSLLFKHPVIVLFLYYSKTEFETYVSYINLAAFQRKTEQ